MSSQVVRTRFRSVVAAWASQQDPAVLLVDTVNEDADPPPGGGLWVTISFSMEGVENLVIGGGITQESGTVTVSVFGAPGKGDAEVVTLADSVAAHFRAIETTLGDGVHVGVVSSPDDFANPGEVSGSWFGLDIDVDYEAIANS